MIHFFAYSLLCLLVFGALSVQGAEVESVDLQSVVIYLETPEDEKVAVGETIYLTDFKGRTTAILKVTRHRGVMVDAVVVEGKPYKSNDVIMPHRAPPKDQLGRTSPSPGPPTPEAATTADEETKSAAIVNQGSIAGAATDLQPKMAKDKKKNLKKRTKLKKPSKASADEDDILELAAAAERKVKRRKLKHAYQADVQYSATRPDRPTPKDFSGEPSNPFDTSDNNWRLSTDLLQITGLFSKYQILNALVERRLTSRLALGAKISFGTYQANANAPAAADRPQVKRLETGLAGTYHLFGDVYEDGFVLNGGFAVVQEDWQSTSNFTGSESSSTMFYLSGSYQMNISFFSLRVGYQFQQVNMEKLANFGAAQFERSPKGSSGFHSYPIFSLGFLL